MDMYTDMVIPLTLFENDYYKEEVVPDDYFGQRIRGSESISSDVQQYRDIDGQ